MLDLNCSQKIWFCRFLWIFQTDEIFLHELVYLFESLFIINFKSRVEILTQVFLR